jgi:transposase
MWTKENRRRYDGSGLRYESDLTDEEWAEIAPFIPPAKPRGNKRTVNLRGLPILERGSRSTYDRRAGRIQVFN